MKHDIGWVISQLWVELNVVVIITPVSRYRARGKNVLLLFFRPLLRSPLARQDDLPLLIPPLAEGMFLGMSQKTLSLLVRMRSVADVEDGMLRVHADIHMVLRFHVFRFVDRGVDGRSESLELVEIVSDAPSAIFHKVEDILAVHHQVKVEQERIVEDGGEDIPPDVICFVGGAYQGSFSNARYGYARPEWYAHGADFWKDSFE